VPSSLVVKQSKKNGVLDLETLKMKPLQFFTVPELLTHQYSIKQSQKTCFFNMAARISNLSLFQQLIQTKKHTQAL
jgi:hypothetical protein